MRVTREQAISVLEFCGFKRMKDKTDAELSGKLAQVQDVLPEKETPSEAVQKLIDEIVSTLKENGSFEVYTLATAIAADAKPAETTAQPTVAPALVADKPPETDTADKPKRTRRTKEQIEADKAAKAVEKAAKKAELEAAKASGKPSRARAGKAATGDARARRGKKASAYVAGEMLKELGIEGGITPEKMARYRVLRGDAVGKLDKWYLTTAWNAICGYLGDFPAKSSSNGAPAEVESRTTEAVAAG